MRDRVALALAAAVSVSLGGCTHAKPVPPAPLFGIPIFPGATLQSASTAGESKYAVYQTSTSLGVVYAWYAQRLPRNAPRAVSMAQQRATFALFGSRSRRTVQLRGAPNATIIMLTELTI